MLLCPAENSGQRSDLCGSQKTQEGLHLMGVRSPPPKAPLVRQPYRGWHNSRLGAEPTRPPVALAPVLLPPRKPGARSIHRFAGVKWRF